MRVVNLTTTDNDFDPYLQNEDWERFGNDNGYYYNNYVARIARISPNLPDKDNDEEWENAIDRIVALGIVFTNADGKEVMYKKAVYEGDPLPDDE